MEKILYIVAPEKFRDEELFDAKKITEQAGYKTIIASNRLGPCHGMMGGTAYADILLDAVRVGSYAAIVFVGGAGSKMFVTHPQALRIAREADQQGIILGAICHAPMILLQAGILTNHKATGSASTIEALKLNGIEVPSDDVVADDLLITATGPSAAASFGSAIVAKLHERLIPS